MDDLFGPGPKPARKRVPQVKIPYDLVEVIWLDAETDNGWEHEDEKEFVVPEVITIGFLIKDTEQLVCVASSTGDDRSHNSRITIPRGMVKTMKVLRKKTVRKKK